MFLLCKILNLLMSWVLCMDYIFNHNIMFYDNVILYYFILDINKIAYTIDII